ncbi:MULTISPECIES: alpha-amylase family glycosyl hydrolase [Alistipes]|uniref:Alpha-amylase n=1 Tax=Alistipes dispar TaxID=2585119 RepID=A0A4Y1X3J5_9BACT|nr:MULTISPECIES: alpha-amylase family glycosyl hydrolase [Alistipes]MBS5643121.1 alpha amylase C-terminal domain-containing protein [Alistipes sp.]HJC20010.1 alpha amylase C-terminal domain-containing protein [Candidatus Alistipes stercoripullorum]MBQ4902476.1 alpha amylase C-terminal domain-containing protein [Alistipes sp. Marseille-P2263]MCI2257755.1 alpha-amylase family glycosyl hydrolase [Alistipes dispar]BBL07344.1 alpha-amylase [Alistipes dispar]
MNQHPEWSYGAVLYEMNVRQLTPEGTLRAAAARLEFLRDLGVDAVWLMPIYPIGEKNRKGTLGSYYSIRDYCAVNPELGTMDDFDDFVAEAHRLGMKVLMDWVANHTSRDARWIAGKPASWYERDASGEPAVPWDWTDTAKLDYANRDVWEAQAAAMEFWIARHAVDGFRCDMAMLVPIGFWQYAAARLRRVKPDLFLLAEAEQRNLFDDGVFDACYGWEMHHLLNDVAQQRVRVTALRDWLRADRGRYPRSAMRLAFTSNHDENSWNGSEFARMGAARGIMAAFTFVVPGGLPLIYTGQEVGYDHSFAFFDRDPIPAESYRANAYTEFYRRLTELRHANPALAAGGRGGDMVEISNNAEDCLMTFVREVPGNQVVAVMNLSPYAIETDYYTGIYAGMYTDALTGRPSELRGHVVEPMGPWSYRILTR